MYERAKVAAKKSKAKEFKTIQTQKNRFNNHSSPLDQILFLQRTIGNQAVESLLKSGIIQAKLKIGKPNDIYEQEADRVAEQIVSSSWSVVNNQMEEREIQRQTEEEERKREEEGETLQLKKMQGNIPEVTPDIESRIRALRGSGQPLPKSIRAFFESRFGYDFSHVRIHNDPEAAKLARALNAEAFTYGRDIYFGEGRYNPNTLAGKRLLAHELTHVVQQKRSKNIEKNSKNIFIQRQKFIEFTEKAKNTPVTYIEISEEEAGIITPSGVIFKVKGLNIDTSYCECKDKIKENIKWAQKMIEEYKKCGSNPSNKTGHDIEKCIETSLKNQGISTTVAGTTSPNGTVTIIPSRGKCGPIEDKATEIHEGVHRAHTLALQKKYGKGTEAFKKAWNDAKNWVKDEVNAYNSEKSFYIEVLKILEDICE